MGIYGIVQKRYFCDFRKFIVYNPFFFFIEKTINVIINVDVFENLYIPQLRLYNQVNSELPATPLLSCKSSGNNY